MVAHESEELYLSETERVYHERFEAMSKEEIIDRYTRGHKAIHLQKYYVDPHYKVPLEKKHEFTRLICEVQSEEEIHQYLKENAYFLTGVLFPGHHGKLCISKARFGRELIADFLIASLDSAGWWWFGVELKSPSGRMFNKDGSETRALRDALYQIDEWRLWLQENLDYARKTRKGLGYTDILPDLACCVIIGRRKNEVLDINQLNMRRQAIVRRDKHGLLLHHYEWLIEEA